MSPSLLERSSTVPTIDSPNDPRDVEQCDEEAFVTEWAMPQDQVVYTRRRPREQPRPKSSAIR